MTDGVNKIYVATVDHQNVVDPVTGAIVGVLDPGWVPILLDDNHTSSALSPGFTTSRSQRCSTLLRRLSGAILRLNP